MSELTPEERFMERMKEASVLYYQEKSGTGEKDPLDDMKNGLELFLDEYLPSDFPEDVKKKTVDYVVGKSFINFASYFKK